MRSLYHPQPDGAVHITQGQHNGGHKKDGDLPYGQHHQHQHPLLDPAPPLALQQRAPQHANQMGAHPAPPRQPRTAGRRAVRTSVFEDPDEVPSFPSLATAPVEGPCSSSRLAACRTCSGPCSGGLFCCTAARLLAICGPSLYEARLLFLRKGLQNRSGAMDVVLVTGAVPCALLRGSDIACRGVARRT